jgi:transcriptional regulator with XRE-family HTH domain
MMTVIDGALIKRRREELRLTVREVAQLMNYANHYSY